MSQNTVVVVDGTGLEVLGYMNDALNTLITNNSGTGAPSETYPFMFWAETDSDTLWIRNAADSAWIAIGTLSAANLGLLPTTAIGVTVQGYDADTAKLDVDQTWSGAQRGTVTTDNDGSFDQSVTNNFVCTPTGTFALTFTNHTAGQSGYVLLVNTGGYAITAAATTKVGASTLATISAAGTYLLSYFDNGTNAYVTASGALS